MSQTKKIVVHSKKGGSTKTSTAVNVAGAFVELGKVVYIKDFDKPYGGATAYFGKEDVVECPLGAVLTTYASDRTKQNLEDSVAEVIPHGESDDVGGLYVFPTSDSLNYTEKVLEGEEHILNDFLEEHLDDLVPKPDFVFLDCRPDTESSLVKSCILAADYILVPCIPNQLDLAAVEGTLGWLNDITGKKSITDDGNVRYGIVINKVKEHRKNRYMHFIYTSESDGEMCLEKLTTVFPYVREHDVLGDDVPSSGLPVTTYVRKLHEEMGELISKKQELESDIEELTSLYKEVGKRKSKRRPKKGAKAKKISIKSRGAFDDGSKELLEIELSKENAETELRIHEIWMSERLPVIETSVAEAIPASFDYMNLTRHVSQEVGMDLDDDIVAWLRKYTPDFESYKVELTEEDEKGDEVFKDGYGWLESYVHKVERKVGKKEVVEVFEWVDSLSEENE